MNKHRPLSPAAQATIAALVVSSLGVVIQIISGHPYPTIPPVFFILLIPAGLVAFGRWRWTPILAVVAGLFLTFGLFASKSTPRLFDLSNYGDSIGLWIQMLAVIAALVAALIATIQNYGGKTSSVKNSPNLH